MVLYLYATLRQENTLAWYRVEADGSLDFQGSVPLPGHGAGKDLVQRTSAGAICAKACGGA